MTPSQMPMHEKILSRRQSLDSNFKPLSASSVRQDFENRLSFRDELIKSKILVADDVRVNRLLLKRNLEKLGHEVMMAHDGREALEKLFENDFDLVLLDMYMPEFNGDEVLRIMMVNKELQNIPVIMVSANEEMTNIVRCIDLGAADYLPKPFDPSLFKARVNACLTWNRKTFRRIELEKNRADHLLSIIYPETIVHELKKTQQVMPRRHDGVAVLFLDIAGFTSYCHNRPAEEVVSKLHDLFCVFEDIAEANGVDKTKTIGDAFMVRAQTHFHVTLSVYRRVVNYLLCCAHRLHRVCSKKLIILCVIVSHVVLK